MKAFIRTAIFGVSMLSLASVAAGRPVCDTARNDAAALEHSRNEVAWQAQNAKGVDKHDLKEEEAKVQDLIDQMQRGGSVDTYAIDRRLNRTY